MDTYERRAQHRFEEQTARFEGSHNKEHFWTTYEQDQYELIQRDRRLSTTYYPKN